MGAYVSTENCAAHYGITPNCTVVLSDDGLIAFVLGESTPGTFQADPDIAGIGVLGAFLSVTVFALFLSIVSTLWWTAKNVIKPDMRLRSEEKERANWMLSVSVILESLIGTCSDQQVFTGGAYAIALRFAKACTVSAYHYNVVANILLVTCATHLMAVTVSRNYWEQPFVSALRIAVTTLVYVITGILLSNQGSGSLNFPTEVPPSAATYSPILLPAACFQSGDFRFGNEIEKALRTGSLAEFFGGQIHGWTNYLIMFLFYIVAVLVSLGRLIRRGRAKEGKRKWFIEKLEKMFPPLFRAKRFFYALFSLYLIVGFTVSLWTVVAAGLYVFQLRRWVDESGWVNRIHNINPENDPSTFGQLVPLLLMSLTVFTFLNILSERVHARRTRKKLLDQVTPRPDNTLVHVVGPHNPHHGDRGSGSYHDKSGSAIGLAISKSHDVATPRIAEIPLASASARAGSMGSNSGSSARHNAAPVSGTADRDPGPIANSTAADPAGSATAAAPHSHTAHGAAHGSDAGNPPHYYLPPIGSFSSPLVNSTSHFAVGGGSSSSSTTLDRSTS